MAPVLIVDDDEGVREAVRMLLEDDGYAVQEAAGREQALALLRAASHPRVVLLDLMIRDGGARDAPILRAVQAESGLDRHCYVLLTGLSETHLTPDLRALIAATCLAVVAKPFDIDDVLDVVQRAQQYLDARPS